MAYQVGIMSFQHFNVCLCSKKFNLKASKNVSNQNLISRNHKLQNAIKPIKKESLTLPCIFAKSMQPNMTTSNKEEKPFALTMLPLHRSKIVHLVRHGQGYHNVANTLNKANYTNWDYEDACLTEIGWQQAEALREHVINLHLYAEVELVVVSPLRRTLQTAVGAWGGGPLSNGEPPNSALMLEGVEYNKIGNKFAQHAPISSAGAPPFIVNEWCREQYGNHPCDKRGSISFLKTKFPAIDFSLVESDEDTWWKPEKRETAEEVFARARIFLKWLLKRPETKIVVVSHSSFIYHMCHLFGDDLSDVVRRELQQGFRNAEMRTVVIGDRQASSYCTNCNTNFAGGLNFKESIAKHGYEIANKIDVSIKEINIEDEDIPQANDIQTIPQDHE